MLGMFLWAERARAHTFAASAFDAVTEGSDVYVQFRIDATSMLDLLNRGRAAADALARVAIDGESLAISDYLGEHFQVGDDGAACAPRAQRPAHFDARTDKVFVALLYRCARPLGVVTLRTALFEDDPTPHQVLGTFRHKRALENYLLSPAAPEAIIDTPHLAQVGPSEASRPGQIHVVAPPPGAFDAEANLPARTGAAPRAGFAAFFVQGVRHILGGIDHVLFVVALVSVVVSFRQLAGVVTSFTLAHSLTLALGALDIVRIPARVVEPLIAASIVYVAVENVARAPSDGNPGRVPAPSPDGLRSGKAQAPSTGPRARLAVTFGFGLVHGFGFSSVLRDLGLASKNLAAALVGFNLGVEAGQLLIVAPLAPLVWWVRRRVGVYPRVHLALNGLVALVAGWWFVQRVTGG